MAVVITKQVLENGPRNYRATYDITSDGTGITAYVAADPTSAGDMGVSIAGNTLFPGVHLKIWRVRYNLAAGLVVALTWDATTDQDAWSCNGFGMQDFKDEGGLYVPQSAGAPIAGATGVILFNSAALTPPVVTVGSIELWLKKDIKQ